LRERKTERNKRHNNIYKNIEGKLKKKEEENPNFYSSVKIQIELEK